MNDFINRRFCLRNGFSLNRPLTDFIQENKRYYREIEDYDWVKVADRFLGLEAVLHRLREKKTLRLIKELGRGKKFLDAGCGTGLILRHLPPGSTGLDINPRHLKRAREYAPRAKLVLGDIEKMPFTNQSFATVVCTEVLEHLLKPQRALKEIFRVLKPGGVLLGSVPAKNFLWSLRFLSSTHPGEPYHRLFSELEIRHLLNQQGKILKIKRSCFGMNFFFAVEKKSNG